MVEFDFKPANDTYADPHNPSVVLGLMLGDEGKGMTVAKETQRRIEAGLNPVVVRFNGGSQAAHNVRRRLDDGTVLHHMHQQIGSGALYGASTILNRRMLVDTVRLFDECMDASFFDVPELSGRHVATTVTVDDACPLVVPLYAKVNHALETKRGDGRHGSTGHGIGVCRTCETAVADGKVDAGNLITVGMSAYPERMYDAMKFWRTWLGERFDVELDVSDDDIEEWCRLYWETHDALTKLGMTFAAAGDTDEIIRNLVDDDDTVGIVFEGSQGMLLDERYGWFPHVTYGDMTQHGALDILDGRPCTVIGCTRTYTTRHGFGPFPVEGTIERAVADGIIPSEAVAAWRADDVVNPLFEPDNGTGIWQGAFRVGLLDMPNLVRMCDVVKPDVLSVSCCDRYPGAIVDAFGGDEDVDGIRNPVPTDPHIESIRGVSELLDVIVARCGTDVAIIGDGACVNEWRCQTGVVERDGATDDADDVDIDGTNDDVSAEGDVKDVD